MIKISENGKKGFFSRLPIQIIYQIMFYLEFHQIFYLESLEELNPYFNHHSQIFIKPYLKILLNVKQEIDFESVYNKILNTWKSRKIINLPFWGGKTDAGVLYHSIPFWLGKGFLKSRNPIFGVSNKYCASIVGYLSQEYYEFEQIVVNLSRLMKKSKNDLQFKQNMEQINLKHVIMFAFHTDIDNLSVEENQKFIDYKQKLYNYAIKLNYFLETNQGPFMNLTDLNRLPLLSNVHQIQFNREFKEELLDSMKNIGQTLLVCTNEDKVPSDFKNQKVPQIESTNLTVKEIQQFNFQTKFSLQNNQQKYIIFKANPLGILLWIDMGNKMNVNLKLPCMSRIWTDKINVNILRGRKETTAQGITFGYISLKGIML